MPSLVPILTAVLIAVLVMLLRWVGLGPGEIFEREVYSSTKRLVDVFVQMLLGGFTDSGLHGLGDVVWGLRDVAETT